MLCLKNRHTDQWSIIKSSEKDPHKCSQLIFNKAAKEKWSSLQEVVGEQLNIDMQKKKKEEKKEHGDLTSLIKIKSKQIIDLYVKCKTKTSRTK